MEFVIKTCANPDCGKTFRTQKKMQRFCCDKCRNTVYFKGYRKARAAGTWEARCEKRDAARKAAKRAFIARREEEFRAHGGDRRTLSVVMVGGRKILVEHRH